MLRAAATLAWAAAATDAPRNGRAGAIFSLHYDQHAHAASPGLGAGASVEHLAEMFRAARPAMVQYHSVGHPGHTLMRRHTPARNRRT